MLYTDGLQYVAEHGGAYWLIDAIVFAQAIPTVVAEQFQFWILAVSSDHTATLACEDGNGKVVHTQKIPFTNNVILLPSEY